MADAKGKTADDKTPAAPGKADRSKRKPRRSVFQEETPGGG